MATTAEQLVVAFRGDISALRTAVTDANAQLDAFRRAADKRAARIKTAFDAIGKSIRSAVIPVLLLISLRYLASAISAPIKKFAELEEGLIKVGKVANLTSIEMKDLGKNIVAIGSSGQIPIATKDLLELTEVAALLGVRGTDNLTKFTRVMARLRIATNIVGREGAESLAKILELTGEPIENVDRIGSAVVELGNNLATTESEIIQFTRQIARYTAQYDVAAKDVLALSAAYSALAQNPQSAASAVGDTFTKLNSAIKRGGEALNIIEKITGHTGKELRDMLSSNRQFEVFIKLLEGLSKQYKAGGNIGEILRATGVISNRGAANMGVLVKRFDLVMDALELSHRGFKENNALLEESVRQMDTLTSKWKILATAMGDRAARIGKPFAPLTKAILTELADVFSPNTIIDLEMGADRYYRYKDKMIKAQRELNSLRNKDGQEGLDLKKEIRTNEIALKLLEKQLAEHFSYSIIQGHIDNTTGKIKILNKEMDALFKKFEDKDDKVYKEKLNELSGWFAKHIETRSKLRKIQKELVDLGAIEPPKAPDKKLGGGDIEDAIDTEYETFKKKNDQAISDTKRLIAAFAQEGVAIQELKSDYEDLQMQIKAEQEARKQVGVVSENYDRTVAEAKQRLVLEKQLSEMKNANLAAIKKEKEYADAIRDIERETEEQSRIINLLTTEGKTVEQMARAYRNLRTEIEVENEIIDRGIELNTTYGQTLKTLALHKEKLKEKTEEHNKEQKRQEQIIADSKAAFKDFFLSVATYSNTLSEALRRLAQRLIELQFERLLTPGTNSLFDAILGGVQRIIGGGGGGSSANISSEAVSAHKSAGTFFTPLAAAPAVVPVPRTAAIAAAPAHNNQHIEIRQDFVVNPTTRMMPEEIGRIVGESVQRAKAAVQLEVKKGGSYRQNIRG